MNIPQDTQVLPKIFVFENGRMGEGDRIGCALAEDGTHLASHWSSNEHYLKHDMGVTGTWKHDKYAEHYPDGYEVVYVPNDERDTHAAFQAALRRNEEKHRESE